MAVIQISKIQIRRGLQENLPQLASGEMGWSIDEQRLWIGNGTLAEGAPQVGNTEILTSNSEILEAIDSYVFKGQESGYTSQTGPSSLNSVFRTLQNKLDDVVNLRDFITPEEAASNDYTAVIQRAINEIYPKNYYSSAKVRRIIKIPAGVYPVRDNITLPPYTNIEGDGPQSTIIRKVTGGNLAAPVIRLRDSRGNVGASINTVTSDPPFEITLRNIGFESDIDTTIMELENCKNIKFDNVKIQGGFANPVNFGSNSSAVRISNSVDYSSDISFTRCQFTQSTHGVEMSGEVNNVSFDFCVFSKLYKGIVAYAALDIIDEIQSPQSVKVSNSKFDLISQQAIESLDVSSIISSLNWYMDVGYGNTVVIKSSDPTSPMITWNSKINFSIGDVFDRDDFDQSIYPIIDNAVIEAATSESSVYVEQFNAFGSVVDRPGEKLQLYPNTTANTRVNLSSTINSAIMDYCVTRSGNSRIGTMKISHYDSEVSFDDEYTENGSLGVTLTWIGNTVTNTSILSYTTDSANVIASLQYSLRTFI